MNPRHSRTHNVPGPAFPAPRRARRGRRGLPGVSPGTVPGNIEVPPNVTLGMATPDADGITRPTMKIVEVTNVDFSLRQFLLPLMREMHARGHEVVGVSPTGRCSTSPAPRAFALPPSRWRAPSPMAQWRAFRALLRLFREESPDIVHAHMPISGFLAGSRRGRRACRASPIPCHGFCSTSRAIRPAAPPASRWSGSPARVTDMYMTVSDEEAADARRLHIARHAVSDRQRTRSGTVFGRTRSRAQRSAPNWGSAKTGS